MKRAPGLGQVGAPLGNVRDPGCRNWQRSVLSLVPLVSGSSAGTLSPRSNPAECTLFFFYPMYSFETEACLVVRAKSVFFLVLLFSGLLQKTRSNVKSAYSSVGRAGDCSCSADISRSLVRFRVGGFFTVLVRFRGGRCFMLFLAKRALHAAKRREGVSTRLFSGIFR